VDTLADVDTDGAILDSIADPDSNVDAMDFNLKLKSQINNGNSKYAPSMSSSRSPSSWSAFLHAMDTVQNASFNTMLQSAIHDGSDETHASNSSIVAASPRPSFVLARTGIDLGADADAPTDAPGIYGGARFHIQWKWDSAIRGNGKTSQGDGFTLYGEKRKLWAGRVSGFGEEYNAIVVEQGRISDTEDLEILIIKLGANEKRTWKQESIPRKRRDLLKHWFEMVNGNATWDPNEREVDVEELILPLVTAETQDPDMEEWKGVHLGNAYRIAVASESTRFHMDEMGGSVDSEVKMVALKEMPAEKRSRHLRFDFRKEEDGFLVFLQATTTGIPDPQPRCLLAGFVYKNRQGFA
jgi:hypothetical protein